MTRLSSAALLGLTLITATAASAAPFVNPDDSWMSFKFSALPSIVVPHTGPGTVSLTGPKDAPTLALGTSVWQTTSAQPGTSLFTGVPLISNLIMTAANRDMILVPDQSVLNPIGPGTITGLIGYGGVVGFARVKAAGGLGFTLDLHKLGATNATTTTLPLGTFPIVATLGPWHTGMLTVTNITTNVVQLPGRVPAVTGIPFTLDPEPEEEQKTFTMSGGFVTSWEASHPNTEIPKSRLFRLDEVTIGGSADFPSTANGTGVLTVVTPMRIDTSDKLVNAVPGVLRLEISFVPEPGTVLQLVAATVGLALVGRSRRKRRLAGS